MKKILLILITTLLLSGCANVDIKTNFTKTGVSREINVFIDNTTYKYNKENIDNYLSGVLSRGGTTTKIFDEYGSKRITTNLSGENLENIISQTEKIFNQGKTGNGGIENDCSIRITGNGGISGIINKNLHIEEYIETSCLEYITGVSSYSYNGEEIGKMEYPTKKTIFLDYRGVSNPIVEIIGKFLLILIIVSLLVFGYIYDVVILKDFIDFIKPSVKKLYYRFVLIVFASFKKK